MSTQHTPGPWVLTTEPAECEGVNVRFSVDSHTRVSICSGQSQEHMNGILEDECRANARLIAAAPELLEALRGLVSQVEGYEDCNGGKGFVLTDAAAAIAKAGAQS